MKLGQELNEGFLHGENFVCIKTRMIKVYPEKIFRITMAEKMLKQKKKIFDTMKTFLERTREKP